MVSRISKMKERDVEEAVIFLERRGALENTDLISHVWQTVQELDDPTCQALILRAAGQARGVAFLRPAQRGADHDLWIELEAADEESAEALFAAAASRPRVLLSTFTANVQAHFDARAHMARNVVDVYCTVSPDAFRPASGPDVVKVTAADADLFRRAGVTPRWDQYGPHFRHFAIVREGRAVSHLTVGFTPTAPFATHRVASVMDLYTEPESRRQGLAKRLVSHATELILAAGREPRYWAAPDNAASLSLGERLGYRPYAKEIQYRRGYRERPAHAPSR